MQRHEMKHAVRHEHQSLRLQRQQRYQIIEVESFGERLQMSSKCALLFTMSRWQRRHPSIASQNAEKPSAGIFQIAGVSSSPVKTHATTEDAPTNHVIAAVWAGTVAFSVCHGRCGGCSTVENSWS
mmetsp:Transcript_33448/g.83529  ORF Transcript_33448/g.83529 Transcript_33448/m.83529 type:complete len:126 (+) Transcript_33448:1386-1763(+)